jgi:hypothetical protein
VFAVESVSYQIENISILFPLKILAYSIAASDGIFGSQFG